MTSKIVVNNIEADAGVSTVTFASEVTAPTFNGNIVGTAATFSGSVGIGTDNPSTKLEVTGDITITNGTQENAIRTNSAGQLQFMRNAAANNSVAMTINDEDGNIGIATANPSDHNNFSRALDINGPSGAAVYMRTNDSTSNCFIVGNYGSDAYLNNRSNGNLRLYTNSSERLRITNTGSVGIGTATPGDGTLVDVTQEFGRTRISKYGHVISQNTLASTTEYWTLAPRNGGEFEIGRGTPDSNGTIADIKLSMQAGGSVTIGGAYGGAGGFDTTNARFSVGNSTANAANFIRIGKRVATTETNLPFITHGSFEGDGNDLILGAHSADGRIRFYTGASNFMPLDNANVERMCITQSGLIGIGTASPTSLIHGQVSSGSAILTLKSTATSGEASVSISGENSSGTTRTGIFKYDNSDRFRIGTTAAIPIAFETSDTERMRILSGGGLTFNGDTSTANALDDYEEGTLSWRLQRDDNIGAGSNVNTRVTYTKIGNRVYISGYIYTANTGSSTSNVNIIIRSDSNTSNVATLPYLPNHSGGFPVTGTRTISDNYRNIAVTFQENSSTVYLYRDDGDNNYVKNTNNVSVAQSQTHLVLQFCGSYTTNS